MGSMSTGERKSVSVTEDTIISLRYHYKSLLLPALPPTCSAAPLRSQTHVGEAT